MNFIQKLRELTQAEFSDCGAYMDTRQDINFKIKAEFEKRGIEMAYPTQTIYLAGGKNG